MKKRNLIIGFVAACLLLIVGLWASAILLVMQSFPSQPENKPLSQLNPAPSATPEPTPLTPAERLAKAKSLMKRSPTKDSWRNAIEHLRSIPDEARESREARTLLARAEHSLAAIERDESLRSTNTPDRTSSTSNSPYSNSYDGNPSSLQAANVTPRSGSQSSKRGRSDVSSTGSQRSYTPSTDRGYIRGPRGGCYYYSGSGRKVYGDRSLCN